MRRKSVPLLFVFCLALISQSCNKNWQDYFNPDGISDHVYRGPIVKMGNGQVRAVFTLSPTGVPQKLSIEMNDAALQGLTQDPTDFAHSMFMLSVPQKVKDLTPFNHLMINWNPKGHPPFEIYGVPHFDFHFYEMSENAQMMIPEYNDQTAATFDKAPAQGFLPSSYVASPGGVPQMGKHWIDPSSPEYHGSLFTKTFIYGTYNGVVTFYEPMITYDYISAGTQSSTAFDQPKYFSPDQKYYPTKYEITRDASKHTHTVSLTDFVWRQTTK